MGRVKIGLKRMSADDINECIANLKRNRKINKNQSEAKDAQIEVSKSTDVVAEPGKTVANIENWQYGRGFKIELPCNANEQKKTIFLTTETWLNISAIANTMCLSVPSKTDFQSQIKRAKIMESTSAGILAVPVHKYPVENVRIENWPNDGMVEIELPPRANELKRTMLLSYDTLMKICLILFILSAPAPATINNMETATILEINETEEDHADARTESISSDSDDGSTEFNVLDDDNCTEYSDSTRESSSESTDSEWDFKMPSTLDDALIDLYSRRK